MILILISQASAEPGRTTAGLSVAVTPAGQLAVRGALDYGLNRRLSLIGEAGTSPEMEHLSLGAGPMLELVAAPWWRVSAVLLPELSVPVHARPELGGRAGLRVSWLAFWGLSFTARIDEVIWADCQSTELAGGLSLRL